MEQAAGDARHVNQWKLSKVLVWALGKLLESVLLQLN